MTGTNAVGVRQGRARVAARASARASAARLARASAARWRGRGQAGFTLVEALLTAAVSGIIAVPVLGWMLTGFKADLVVRSSSERTGLTTQLTQVFPRDLASAGSVRYTIAGGAVPAGSVVDCADAAPTDELVVSVMNGDGSRLIAYAVSRSGNTTSLIRRVCPLGQATATSEVIGTSTQNNGPIVVESTPRLGGAYAADAVSGVDISFRVPSTKPITVSGSLRGGVDP